MKSIIAENKDQGEEILKDEAYIAYAVMTKDEA